MHPASWRRLACGLACGLFAAGLAAAPANAQSWWPFGGNDEAPRPREPVYRQPQPIPAPIPNQAPPPGTPPAPGSAANWSTKNPICLQLEQRLIQEGQKGTQSRDQLPKLEAEIHQVDKTYNTGQSQLDKSCYEYFLFTKSFRSSPQCKELLKQVEVAKRRLAELEVQRQDIVGSAGRSHQDDIVRELARNNCGANYVDQARRRDGGGGGMWQEEESVGHNNWSPQTGTGVATYRTLCVRLCDGYYFPVSFATLPSHFPQDAEVCQSKCSAPTELYYHPNPGGSMDQALALKSQEPYTRLKVAFRYRKEFVNGCSCKEAEFVPATVATDKKAETPAGGGPAAKVNPGKRADGSMSAAPQGNPQNNPAAPQANAAAQPDSTQITTGAITPVKPAVAPVAGTSPAAAPVAPTAVTVSAAAVATPPASATALDDAAPEADLPPIPMPEIAPAPPAPAAIPAAPKPRAPQSSGAQPPQ